MHNICITIGNGALLVVVPTLATPQYTSHRSMKPAYASSVMPPAFWRLVAVTPGLTLFTRIPNGARSIDAHLRRRDKTEGNTSRLRLS